jgi:acetyl esterase/lipase
MHFEAVEFMKALDRKIPPLPVELGFCVAMWALDRWIPTPKYQSIIRLPLTLLLPALLGFSVVAHAQGVRQKTFEERVNAPVVLTLPRMNDVKVLADQHYASAHDPNLLMDVYLPPDLEKDERRAVVILVHGGTDGSSASRPKDWGFYKSWGRLIAASGYVAVSFTHRLGYAKPHLADSAQDVSEAIDHVRANAAPFSVDPERVALAVFSAGGPSLTLGLDEKRPYVRCLIGFYAFLDVQQSAPHREHESPELLRRFSMIEHLGESRARAVPLFIARAGRDSIPAMNDSIDRFIARAILANANVVVWNHPEGVHGFDNQNNDARSREIVRAVLSFMKEHLG